MLETTPRGAYRLSTMLDDLRGGIWGADLAGAGPIDVWRRNLQRAHLARLNLLMNQEPPPPPAVPGAPAAVLNSISDIRPLVRAQLTSLRALGAAQGAAHHRSGDPSASGGCGGADRGILEPRRQSKTLGR